MRFGHAVAALTVAFSLGLAGGSNAGAARGAIWINDPSADDASKVPNGPADATFVTGAIDYDKGVGGPTIGGFLNNPRFLEQSRPFIVAGGSKAPIDNMFIQIAGDLWLARGANTFVVGHDDGVVLTIAGYSSPVVYQPGPTAFTSNAFTVFNPGLPGARRFILNYTECCGDGAGLKLTVNNVNPGVFGPTAHANWMETVMDATTVVVTVGLLAFLVERLTNGIAVILGYLPWWRRHMEAGGETDPATQAAVQRNRRVALFVMSAILASTGAIIAKVNLLVQLNAVTAPVGASPTATPSTNAPPQPAPPLDPATLAGYIVTGLLIASGADPIRELLQRRGFDRDARTASPAPIQVTGTLVVRGDADRSLPVGD